MEADEGCVHIFQQGDFTLHSGGKSFWKINCDALSNGDWATLAKVISKRCHFSGVVGIPSGGLKLAGQLQKYCQAGYPVLIVDDVLTTGNSMEEARKYYPDAIGFVVFARGKCPDWVTPLFALAKEVGWVRLAEDQNLPHNPFDARKNYEESERRNAYNEGQQDMLKEGWRKVELGK